MVGQSVEKLEGIVLLAPAGGDWHAAHYGLRYHIRLEDGVVTQSTQLWLSALFFTLDLPNDRLHEWLSHTPLSTIPDGYERPPVDE